MTSTIRQLKLNQAKSCFTILTRIPIKGSLSRHLDQNTLRSKTKQ